MIKHLGETRTVIRRNHAFISPDGHVRSPMAGWEGTEGILLVSPGMGAHFTMYLANIGPGSTTNLRPGRGERFFYILDGSCRLSGDSSPEAFLEPGSFVYLPPETPCGVAGMTSGRLLAFERPYAPLPALEPPPITWGSANDRPAVPFLGDERALLTTLLPDTPEYDLAVNIFTFQPGASLPFVETHVMEHGLLMLTGGGIYRLGEDWYPIQAGDALWMGPYCPQWFGALGRMPASYIYYKDINRTPSLPKFSPEGAET